MSKSPNEAFPLAMKTKLAIPRVNQLQANKVRSDSAGIQARIANQSSTRSNASSNKIYKQMSMAGYPRMNKTINFIERVKIAKKRGSI